VHDKKWKATEPGWFRAEKIAARPMAAPDFPKAWRADRDDKGRF